MKYRSKGYERSDVKCRGCSKFRDWMSTYYVWHLSRALGLWSHPHGLR